MTRRFILLLSLTVLAGAWAVPQAGAEPHGALCHIAGKASFSKGLTSEEQPVTYSFTGTLDNCASSDDSYTGATLKAKGKGNLSCGQGESTGVAIIKWNTGKKSIVKYTTTSYAAIVSVDGTVTGGVFKGDSSVGALVFEANAPDCFGAGVKSATFDGVDAYGNYE